VKKQIAPTLLVWALLFSSIFFALPAQANFKPAPLPHVYIQTDGSINPSSVPISRVGNIYFLTGNLSGYVLDVRASNIVVEGAGYSVVGSGNDDGILITHASNVTVRNFILAGRNIYIHLNGSSHCRIAENRMSGANSYGIWLSDRSDNNVISGNKIDQCYYGIYLGNSRGNVFRNNIIVGGKHVPALGQNLALVGDGLADFVNDVDDSNIVNGKPVYYWVNKHNAEVPSNAGYVALVNCSAIIVQNQNLTENKHGILLAWTSGSTVRDNILESNAIGIYLLYSWGNSIINNVVSDSHGLDEDNEGHGIRLQNSYNNLISDNNASSNMGAGICVSQSPGTRLIENSVNHNSRTGITIINKSNYFVAFGNYISDNSGVALRVADCANGAIVANNITKNRYFALYLTGSVEGNSVYGNTFADNRVYNTLQALVSSTTHNPTWDNGTIGNYWSDYLTLYPNATEIGSSGIGNTTYALDGNNIDSFPLIKPLNASLISMPEVAVPSVPSPTPESMESSLPTPKPTETPILASSPTLSPPLSTTITPTIAPTDSPSSTSSEDPAHLQNAQPTNQPSSSSFPVEWVYAIVAVLIAIIVVAAIVKTRKQKH
jgi:parallel beta-helix repeat protein